MRVLVTGGAGFIGSHTVDEVADRGYEPLIFDRLGRTHNEHETMLGDVRDEVAVTEAVAHADAVIHLAAVLGTQETIQNPRPAAETNVLGGLNVLDACRQYDVPLTYIAVGNHWMQNSYAITKTTVERFCHMYRNEHDLRVGVVRALNAYGPRQVPVPPWGSSRVRKIMPSFVLRALTGQPIEVYGDGGQVMDMIWVRDVARVLVTTLERVAEGEVIPEPVQAGTGRDTTVLDIAQTVLNAVGRDPEEVDFLPMRPGEPERSVVLADTSTLDPVRISPDSFVPLEKGVEATVEFFQQNYVDDKG